MKALAEKIKPYLKLFRVGNLSFMAILLFVMEKWVAVPLLHVENFQEMLPWWVLSLLILSVVLIAAGGYVINDYFDVKIDRINRPDDLVVTHVISRDTAMRIFQICTVIGIIAGVVVSWWAHSWNLLFIYIVIPGLLWFYSASYKRMFLVGNLVVAFVSALLPLLVSITNADYLRSLYQESLAYTPIVGQLYLWLGAFAAFAFLLTLAREMVKDIEDIDGDCEMECRTAPIVWGVKKTKVLISIILLLTAVFILYIAFYALPFPMEWKSLPMRFVLFGLLVPIVCAIVLLFAANSRQEYQRTQHVLKFIMFLGTMFSYVIYTNLMA